MGLRTHLLIITALAHQTMEFGAHLQTPRITPPNQEARGNTQEQAQEQEPLA
jgi:hypothetical protein